MNEGHRVRQSVDDVPFVMALVTSDGHFGHVNDALCRFLGLDPQTAPQKARPTLLPSDCLDRLLDGRIDACRTTEHHVHADGRVIWADLSVSCIRDPDGKVQNFLVVITDVTDRVAAEERNRVLVQQLQRQTERLAASERTYRLLVENVGDVVCHIRDGAFAWLSPNAATLLGAPAEHWLGRAVSEILPPDDAQAHAARWKILSEGGSLQQRLRITPPGGDAHWIHMNAKVFRDHEGRPDGAVAALRLIDDEVAAEHALGEARRQQAETAERYRRSMQNAAVAICLTRPDGRLDEVNDAACRLFGYDAETLKQKTWQELTPPEYLEVGLQHLSDLREGRIESFREIKQYIHADGHLIWVDLSVSCLRDGDGRLINDIALISDITAQVEAGQRSTAIPVEIGDHRDPLGAMQTALDTLWSNHPHVPDDVRMQMAIAAGEVVANIIEHTGDGHPVRIRMSAALVGDQVHVAFADNGPPADIDLTCVEMPDEMAARGRGLALAQAVLEQLAHCCDESGNHWTLIGQRFA